MAYYRDAALCRTKAVLGILWWVMQGMPKPDYMAHWSRWLMAREAYESWCDHAKWKHGRIKWVSLEEARKAIRKDA